MAHLSVDAVNVPFGVERYNPCQGVSSNILQIGAMSYFELSELSMTELTFSTFYLSVALWAKNQRESFLFGNENESTRK